MVVGYLRFDACWLLEYCFACCFGLFIMLCCMFWVDLIWLVCFVLFLILLGLLVLLCCFRVYCVCFDFLLVCLLCLLVLISFLITRFFGLVFDFVYFCCLLYCFKTWLCLFPCDFSFVWALVYVGVLLLLWVCLLVGRTLFVVV